LDSSRITSSRFQLFLKRKAAPAPTAKTAKPIPVAAIRPAPTRAPPEAAAPPTPAAIKPLLSPLSFLICSDLKSKCR